MSKALWILPPVMIVTAFLAGMTIGYKLRGIGLLEKPPAPVRADMVFSDWGSSVNTNPNGLYLHNTSNSPLWCKLKESNGIEIQPHAGFWLTGEPGPFYDCIVTEKGTKRPAKKLVGVDACAETGEICYKWHNAVLLWQWENDDGSLVKKIEQWPTVVCDKWGVRR